MSTEQHLTSNSRAVVEPLSSGPVKRKRSRSSGSETEDPLSVKKKTLVNGEAADSVSQDTVATTEAKQQSTGERVVILDAGAQYGKVLMSCIDCS